MDPTPWRRRLVVLRVRNGAGGLVQVLYAPARGPAIVRWIAKDDIAP